MGRRRETTRSVVEGLGFRVQGTTRFVPPRGFKVAGDIYICLCIYIHRKPASARNWPRGRDFFIDNLLVQIHHIIYMILVDRPCAMEV